MDLKNCRLQVSAVFRLAWLDEARGVPELCDPCYWVVTRFEPAPRLQSVPWARLHQHARLPGHVGEDVGVELRDSFFAEAGGCARPVQANVHLLLVLCPRQRAREGGTFRPKNRHEVFRPNHVIMPETYPIVLSCPSVGDV